MNEEEEDHANCLSDLVPKFAALRFSICPSQMKEDDFWRAYFIILHNRTGR